MRKTRFLELAETIKAKPGKGGTQCGICNRQDVNEFVHELLVALDEVGCTNVPTTEILRQVCKEFGEDSGVTIWVVRNHLKNHERTVWDRVGAHAR